MMGADHDQLQTKVADLTSKVGLGEGGRGQVGDGGLSHGKAERALLTWGGGARRSVGVGGALNPKAWPTCR